MGAGTSDSCFCVVGDTEGGEYSDAGRSTGAEGGCSD